ncbi:ATP-binding protein [Streptomyces sp. NPDC059897]|uniref:ATP-binding protein n=1 Tax=Streptomyces sp. NPDC059897 TaxID=3346994 RepID=UPI00364EE464
MTVENLPVEATQFIGREAELAYLEQELSDHRLLTLTGVGGVGKTRLAARLALRTGPRLADAVCFVPLSPLRDPTLLGNVLLEELRLADNSNEDATDVVAQWLADKRVLLVLDTCEHLLADCGRLIRKLLDVAPGLRVLATSRQPLGIEDEHRFTVAPLPVTAEGDAGRPGDAVALFADRAALAAPGFRLGPAERDVAEAVCRHLDGIPLAIELAAARLTELPLERLGSLLGDRLDALTAAEGHTGPPRHRTLRATIGWSHELCTPLERLLWARLSVFTGGFDPAGARAVGRGGPLRETEVSGALEGLVAKSLVRRRPGGRYDMLDTVREFGASWLEQLGPEEATGARRRHRDFHLELARRADAGWMGREQEQWYERLVTDHPNFRTALDFCLETREGPAAQQLCGHLWILWFPCGFAREGRRYAEAALALSERPGPEYLLGLWGCATAALSQGDTETGLKLAGRFRDLTQPDPSPAQVMAVAYLESTSLCLMGRLREAADVIDAAPDLRGYTGPYDSAWCLTTAGRALVHVLSGEFTEAAVVARRLEEECGRRGERWSHTWASWAAALAANGQGRPDEAARQALATIAGKSRFRDRVGVALAVDALASSLSTLGTSHRAARLLGIGQRMWEGLGRPQLGSPELVATRNSTERRIRESVGDSAYEAQYAAGLGMETADGIAYSLATEAGVDTG